MLKEIDLKEVDTKTVVQVKATKTVIFSSAMLKTYMMSKLHMIKCAS